MKLGRLRSTPDPRTLHLRDYLLRPRTILPALPPCADWTPKVTVPWGMLANDQVGDCVLAAAAHMIMQWRFNAGDSFVPTDQQVLADYSAITGYVPGDPDTDQGTAPLAALKRWRKQGLCGGHKIAAFMATQAQRPAEIKYAIALMEGSYMAYALPQAAQELDVWDLPAGTALTGDWEPGSWGGHMVEAVKYDDKGVYVVTWGALKLVTWAFAAAFCDESYALIGTDLLDRKGQSASGLNLQTLRADLQAIDSL
jgi:hypothetical protein